jgi:hypothetical protein
MYIPFSPKPLPYEDTRTWNALRDALHDLDKLGAVELHCGERHILAVLCASLERAGVFSLGEFDVPVRR